MHLHQASKVSLAQRDVALSSQSKVMVLTTAKSNEENVLTFSAADLASNCADVADSLPRARLANAMKARRTLMDNLVNVFIITLTGLVALC
jgi:hypothetical protein